MPALLRLARPEYRPITLLARPGTSTAAPATPCGPQLGLGRAAACGRVVVRAKSGDEPSKQKKPKEKDSKKKALKAQLKTALEELQRAEAALEAQEAQDAQDAPEGALAAREAELWDRQRELMEAQEKRFEEERQRWAAREAALMQQLSETQRQLVSLALGAATQLPAAAPEAPPLQQAATSGNAVTDHVEAFFEESQAPTSQPAAPVGPPKAVMTPEISPHAADLAAAVSRVDAGDVLSDVDQMIAGNGTPASEAAGTAESMQTAFTEAFAAAADGGDDVMDGVDEILAEFEAEKEAAAEEEASGGDPWDSLFSSDGASEAPAPVEAARKVDPDTADVDDVLAATPWSFSGGPASSKPSVAGTPIDAAPPARAAEPAPKTAPAPSTASPSKEPPPLMTVGSDDIYWVNQLQAGLIRQGYYCGESEAEDWYFGDHTMEALLTFQACSGIEETGITDEDTWAKLLGENFEPVTKEDMAKLGILESDADKQLGGGAAAALGVAVPPVEPSAPAAEPSAPAAGASAPPVAAAGASEAAEQLPAEAADHGPAGAPVVTARWSDAELQKWPVLMEGDGGKGVHALHVAMERAGYHPGDDDIEWWTYGDTTMNAVRTYQACNGLPESGIVDRRMWESLLGPGAGPHMLADLRMGDATDDDMCGHDEAVWLIGEQRWEVPGRRDKKN